MEKAKTLYDLYETDTATEKNEGIEISFGEAGTVRVLRAGGSNQKYHAVQRREFKKHRHAIDADLMTEEQSASMLAIIYADAVIVGWEGVTDRKGKKLEFTRKNVIGLLEDLPGWFADLRQQASSMENFRKAELEEDSGNL